MGRPVEIRSDLATPAELRALARRERTPRTTMRLLAIAHALEGMSRAEAARLVGMERQALRDAVIRYNVEGVEGLRDRPKSGRKPCLSDAEQGSLRAVILRGPGTAGTGRCRCCAAGSKHDSTAAASGEPVAHRSPARSFPAEDPANASAGRCEGASRIRKRGLSHAVDLAAAAHPDKRIELWFMDGARVGQKGRTGYRWWLPGERPRGLCDRRFDWTYLYAAAAGQRRRLCLWCCPRSRRLQ